MMNLPKDVKKEILYRVNPQDFDAICSLNQDMEQVCLDERFLEEYVNIHDLLIKERPNPFYRNLYYRQTTNLHSVILLSYILKRLKEIIGEELFNEEFQDIIVNLSQNKKYSDLEIIDILKSLFSDIINIDKIFYTLTYSSIIDNRPELEQWLYENEWYDYQAALNAFIFLRNDNLFDSLLNTIIENKINIDWLEIFRELIYGQDAPYLYGIRQIEKIRPLLTKRHFESLIGEYIIKIKQYITSYPQTEFYQRYLRALKILENFFEK